jgi:hypothetical protein
VSDWPPLPPKAIALRPGVTWGGKVPFSGRFVTVAFDGSSWTAGPGPAPLRLLEVTYDQGVLTARIDGKPARVECDGDTFRIEP